jgi:hypothetical protein
MCSAQACLDQQAELDISSRHHPVTTSEGRPAVTASHLQRVCWCHPASMRHVFIHMWLLLLLLLLLLLRVLCR